MRMPNAKSAGHLQSYLLSPSGSMTRSAASTTASAVTHAEGPTTKRRPSSPARRPCQASAGGALHSLHSSFTGSPSWATSRGSHSGASVCSTAAAVGANQPHADVERKMRHKSAAAYVEQHGRSGLGEPEEQDAAPSSTPGQPDKRFVIGDQGGPPLPGRPSVGVGGMMEAWGCNSGVASVAPSLEPGISSGQPTGAKSTTAPAPAVTAHAAVHTPKGSMSRGMVDEGAEAHVLGAGSAVATVRARKGTAVSKGGGGDDHEDEGASAASMDSSPRLGHNSPKGPLFSPVPPASEPSHAPPRGDSRLSAPIPKLSVADPHESPFNRPSKIVSDDGTRRAETQQEALKPPHSVRTRPMSALKPRSSSASPYPPGSASSAGATKRAAVSMDAPKTPVPNSSGSSPHTPSSPGKQGGPIRIQSSRSMVRKSKAADEGLPGFFDLAQQQPSPKAGLAGLALGSAHRRSALQASNAPLKATPHSQLTEPMARSTDFHNSSEPRQRSKLRKNSTAEGSGSRSPAGGALGDTKRAPPRGKSILNIKAALGSAMASVLNPVMQTQRK
ncbi:hypothetical protein DUNSADRAFT_9782 [Dunaliella salina]|uniref:Uncharacterized protein n=1 Tax=Dunaliella salina TaxID=3046 RepID=A0ABQ7GGR1_DUNSA|nr:hypothetical protein DUNSADRAFT_9782 [Dunaliella salina]|eukprot:KAF5833796.1 hypothetical protein DUNSADRAFT_9782 [Dunaliella salina]